MSSNQEYGIEPVYDAEEIKKRPSRWRGFFRVVAVLFIVLCLVVGIAAGVGLYLANGLTPVEASDASVRIIIPKGIGSSEISKLLEDHGLIRSGNIFKYYLRYKNEGGRFQAGEYEIKPGTKLDRMITMLNNGEVVKEPTVRFTIPEGYSIVQIVDLLSKKSIVNSQTMMETIQAKEGVKGKYLSNIPDDAQLLYKLEGYLFPETYEMLKKSTETEIINRMLKELDQRIETLPVGWQDELKARNISFHQMLTIASLIEREVVLDDERPIVAGVIYNRLKEKMPLQIDATVQYLMKEQKERLLLEDLKIESPYNTYLHTGLPPGPIASPSLSSIKAAIYPEKNNFLYYVTKKDGTQGHLFAETYKQHQANIKQSNNP